jgi:hypothetical protein
VSAKGFGDWSLPSITLAPGQYLDVTGITLAVTDMVTVQAAGSTEVIAKQQVDFETKQRAFGVLPMFYAVYDSNPVPLGSKLKFKLAFRTAIDPFSIGADFFLAGVKQADNSPSYGQGFQGYAKRVGADYANGFTDIMIGGLCCPRSCIRIQGTSTRAPARRNRVCYMRFRARLSPRGTTGTGSQTTPVWAGT